MRRAYLAEVVELAYLGSSGGEWGLRLSDLAMDQIVHGYHINLLYRLVGLMAVIIILNMLILGMVRMFLDIAVRAVVIARVHVCAF